MLFCGWKIFLAMIGLTTIQPCCLDRRKMNNEFWPIIVPMTPCPDSSISNSRPRGVLDPEEVTRVVDAVSPRHLKLFQCGVLCANHSGRVAVAPRDLQFVRRIFGEYV